MAAADTAFSGRHAFVTGAASGIGRACALALARSGCKLSLTDADSAGLKETERQIYQIMQEHDTADRVASSVVCMQVDVCSEEGVASALGDAVTKLGVLSIAVNCAGIEGVRAELHELDVQDFDRVLATNARGVFVCMKHEIKHMLKAQPQTNVDSEDTQRPVGKPITGSIVNVSSTAALHSMAEFGGYAASKAAVVSLTKTAAKEYASFGIRVNSVAPATTETPMVQRFREHWPDWQAKTDASYPIGRIARADEIANAVVFMAGPACEFATGTVLTVDGGLDA